MSVRCSRKLNSRVYLLKLLKNFNLPTNDLVTIYSGFVRPTIGYAATVWHLGLTIHEDLALERIQRRACKITVGKDYTTYYEALELCNLQGLHGRREQRFLNSLTLFLSLTASIVGCHLREVSYTVECSKTLTNLPCRKLEQPV